MYKRFAGLVMCALVVAACQDAGSGIASPSAAHAVSAVGATGSGSSAASAGLSPKAGMAAERPWKAHLKWTVVGLQWANPVNPLETSLFSGRCSVLSNYVIYGVFEGEATHAGRVTGTTAHCSQLIFGPAGPVGATYTDGQGSVTTANGSTITMRYANGVSGYDVQAGENWFEDTWTFTEGTGLFAGVDGTGQEGGRFKDFGELLSGAPVAMWMEGSITFSPSGKQ
jgi:hypothetical protein